MANVIHRPQCRLCSSKNRETVLRLVPTPVGDHYVPSDRLAENQEVFPLDLAYCRDCHHLELPDAVDPNILYGNYIYNTAVSLGLVQHFDEYAADALTRIQPQAGSLVIDIGSNDGTLLKGFKKRGMQVLGIDPASRAAAKAEADGVSTIIDFFSPVLAKKIRSEHPPVKIVTANNVFANIDALSELMLGVRELLAADGVFIFETGYMPDTIENTIVDNIYHEHLCYFAVTPLEKFFARHEMELIDVSRVETKGGSLRGVAQLKGGGRSRTASVEKFINDEGQRGFHSPAPHQAFAKRVNQARDDLKVLLSRLKSEKKKVIGYGASVGVTTLLYHFELSKQLDFLVDDNAIRHGLFSPGHHIPVKPSAVIYETNPDYILILAWRYLEPIKQKHQAYLDRGGKFILPLPKVSVI